MDAVPAADHRLPHTLPGPHRAFLERCQAILRADHRIVGVAAGGSYLTDTMDAFSDLDLVVAVEPAALADVMADREAVASACGRVLASFTGEHVGEPRLLICLYDEAGQPLHVDLKFVSLPDVAARVEDPAILWERDGRVTAALQQGTARFPAPDPQWIDDRFWTWVHYTAGKIGRAELFEALDALAFLRGRVLGPLALQQAGARPAGVRRLETAAPGFAGKLESAVACYDAASCVSALRACIALYGELRPATVDSRRSAAAEAAACRYVDDIAGSMA